MIFFSCNTAVSYSLIAIGGHRKRTATFGGIDRHLLSAVQVNPEGELNTALCVSVCVSVRERDPQVLLFLCAHRVEVIKQM